MVYIIFGASGSGKTTLIEIIKSEFSGVSVHVKGTTRDLRQYDNGELVSFPNGLPAQYDYVYGQYGYEYGIEKNQINKAISNNDNHFIICNDIEVLKKIKSDFHPHARAVYLHYSAPVDIVRAIQRSKKITDDEIELRISKINSLATSFIENSDLFDAILNNVFSPNFNKSLKTQIKNILESDGVSGEKIAESISELTQEMKKSLAPNLGVFQKGLLFIIMAMVEDDTVQDIFYTLKTTARDAGFTAERVDDVFGYDTINAKLLKHIELAEVIIADLTFERPNCYYELGYAHCYKKNVILTAKTGTTIHFDISNYNVIFYDNMKQLSDKLSVALGQHKEMQSLN